jgi:aminotransferase EvaB
MSTTSAPIEAFDYVEQYESLRNEILAAVDDVLSSGRLILGPRVEAFETSFAEFLDVAGHAVGVANGTDALAIALRAMAIGAGDEVISVANTAVPTATAIQMVGATPIFCEIDPQTLLIDSNRLESLISERTKAIVPVHLFGNAVDMDSLVDVAHRRGLAVVEDCAQACGTTWRGRAVGTFGDVGCFSFYPTKNLGGYGDGGLCFTRHSLLADAMREIRGYGCNTFRQCVRPGMNSRLDELQAAILSVKLAHLPDWLARRRRVAGWYDESLTSGIVRPRVARAATHSYHLYVVATAARAALMARLSAERIGFGIHYPTPLHRMSGLVSRPGSVPSLPITERMAERVLSLPCYPELTQEAVQAVCAVVNDVVGAQG